MPITKDDLAEWAKTDKAFDAALTAAGTAIMQLAKPACPKITGNLQRSHRMKLEGDHVVVGVTAEYGGYVHNGTSKRKAKPWLRDVVAKNGESIGKAAEKAWKGALP